MTDLSARLDRLAEAVESEQSEGYSRYHMPIGTVAALAAVAQAAEFVAFRLGEQGGGLSDAESHLRHFLAALDVQLGKGEQDG